MFHQEEDFRAWKTLQKFGYRLLGRMRELFSILRLLLTKTQIISDITFQSSDITCCGTAYLRTSASSLHKPDIVRVQRQNIVFSTLLRILRQYIKKLFVNIY